MTTDEEYAVMVARGAALLDEKTPGWPAKVGLYPNTFSGHDCVSVRATGMPYWTDSMDKLGLTIEEYTEHGFRAKDQDDADAVGKIRDPYDVLNGLWREEVAKRITTEGA